MLSSRPLRAGSIAAAGASRPPGSRPGGSPRPLRAGSIAAMGVRVTGRHAAPVIPPITGGLHCGLAASVTVWQGDQGHPAHYGRAPLRPRSSCRTGPARGVIPPITGGLHCGSLLARDPNIFIFVIPPITGGLHCGGRDRAGYDRTGTVIPPITGGLHCGG